MQSFEPYVELAEHIDLIAPGVAFTGSAIFYLLVEIVGYPLATLPTLSGVRWLRLTLIAVFLLVGLALLVSEIAISAPVLFRALFQREVLAPFAAPCLAVAPLLVICLLVMFRSVIDEMRRALIWRRWRREQVRRGSNVDSM